MIIEFPKTKFQQDAALVFKRLSKARSDFYAWYEASGYTAFQMGMGPDEDDDFYADEAYGIIMGMVDERNFVGENASEADILRRVEGMVHEYYTTWRDKLDELYRERYAEWVLSEPVTT